MTEPQDDQPLDESWDSGEEQDETPADDEADLPASDAADPAPREGDADRPRRRRRKTDDYLPKDDERSMVVLKFMTDVLREMEVDCRVRLKRPREDDARKEICLEIIGRDAGRIIGKKGMVLTALQFLAHRVVNRPGLERRPVVVDAEGYRSRRDNSLASMAKRLGQQAVAEGKIITFEPMNPRDRRVIHLALADFEGVVTKSDGEGDSRRVQIIPVRHQD
jgi:spoIIIJ-associated protein